eukprot:484384_1
MAKRPEHIAPPELFYDEKEARKYGNSTRMMAVQSTMSARAIELLNLPDRPCYLLDVGCGSGLSGEVLSEYGHVWVGTDISSAMLGVAVEREVEGDLCYADMGQGMFFRNGIFDGCISISALQWLCNADKKCHRPKERLEKFFQTLYNCLVPGARAIFQLYPETPQSMQLITECAMRCGFSGGLVIDYPNSTKAKKMFLCLDAGTPRKLPEGLSNGSIEEASGPRTSIAYNNSSAMFHPGKDTLRDNRRNKHKKRNVKDRDWIQAKKDKMRRRGRRVARDSKFTGRKRRPQF